MNTLGNLRLTGSITVMAVSMILAACAAPLQGTGPSGPASLSISLSIPAGLPDSGGGGSRILLPGTSSVGFTLTPQGADPIVGTAVLTGLSATVEFRDLPSGKPMDILVEARDALDAVYASYSDTVILRAGANSLPVGLFPVAFTPKPSGWSRGLTGPSTETTFFRFDAPSAGTWTLSALGFDGSAPTGAQYAWSADGRLLPGWNSSTHSATFVAGGAGAAAWSGVTGALAVDFHLARTPVGGMDTGFGSGGGAANRNLLVTNDDAVATVVDSSGRTVIAGTVTKPNGSGTNESTVYLARYLENGLPDKSFGEEGYRYYDIYSAQGEEAIDIAVAGTTLYVMARNIPTSTACVFRVLADGTRDLGFGGSGRVQMDFTALIGTATTHEKGALAVNAAGTAIAVACDLYDSGSSNSYVGLAMLQADGSYISGFGTNGRASADLGASIEYKLVNAVAFQDDGKLLVAGTVAAAETNFFAVRFTATGASDGANFAGAGYNITNTFATANLSGMILMDFDAGSAGQEILLWGNGVRSGNSNSEAALILLNASGIFMSVFGGNGIAYIAANVSYNFTAAGMARGSGNDLYLSYVNDTTKTAYVAKRYMLSSSIATAGDFHGGTDLPFSPTLPYTGLNPRDLARRADGSLALAGSAVRPGDTDTLAAVVASGGASLTGLGEAGALTTTFGYGPLRYQATVALDDGSVLAGGYLLASGTRQAFYDAYGSDGTRTAHVVLHQGGWSASDLGTAAMGPDGAIYLAGTYVMSGTTNIFIYKLNADGTVASYGSSGYASFPLPSMSDVAASAIAVDYSGNAYVGGTYTDFGATETYAFFMRMNGIGSGDGGYGVQVIPEALYQLGTDTITGLALDAAAGRLYACGYAYDMIATGNENAFVAAFDTASKTFDVSFDHDGTADGTYWLGLEARISGTDIDSAAAVMLARDGSVMVAGNARTGMDPFTSVGWTVRLSSAGIIDPGYGDAGAATFTYSEMTGVKAAALHPDGTVLLACSLSPPNPGSSCLVRVRTDGSATRLSATYPAPAGAIPASLNISPAGDLILAGFGFVSGVEYGFLSRIR